ncbi:MAG: hypothetical protein WAU70_10260 [Flavobacteriales bacterium]
MRHSLALLMLGVLSSAKAQTVLSVQDGDWDDPATWDCACVPMAQNTIVMHTVQITGNMFLPMQEFTISASGVLTMDLPHSLAVMESVLNIGTMLLKGNIDVDGEIVNNGTISIDGNLYLDNLLVMDGPGTLLTTTNIGNAGLITGSGRICVREVSDNDGTIQGSIDFCDMTPTTATPPIIDFNSGVVEPSVTFCLTGGCMETVPEVNALLQLNAWPVPAGDKLTIDGLPPASTVDLFDALGRWVPMISRREGDHMIVETGTVPAGCYNAVVSTTHNSRSLAVMVLH